MLGEQQAVIPNLTSNPNPNPPHSVVISNPIVHSPTTDSNTSPSPHSLGFDGSQAQPALEPASRTGIVSDSATYKHAGGTLTDAIKVSTTMDSADNLGVVTQHVVHDVIVTKQPENSEPVICEVCNVTCNSQDVLERHKLGKKHFKQLQKLAIASVIAPKMPPPVASAPSVGELEIKKHKLLQNGASVDTLLNCDICNVVCNNEDVFRKHLAGKKHSAKATIQLAITNGISNITSEGSLEAQPSNGSPQKKPDTVQQTVWCEICKVSCTSNEVLNNHLSGKKHLKKLKESEQLDWSMMEGNAVNSHEGKPAWCDLCGISCDSYDMLKNHISGKKHQKNLEKSGKPIGPNPAPASEPASFQNAVKEEGKIVNVDGSNRKAKRMGGHEDLETKKQKVLQGGAASDALRTCTVCNVVCNSPTVFISHLAGQKHAAMAVKHAQTGQGT